MHGTTMKKNITISYRYALFRFQESGNISPNLE